jgi:hypothetical protein
MIETRRLRLMAAHSRVACGLPFLLSFYPELASHLQLAFSCARSVCYNVRVRNSLKPSSAVPRPWPAAEGFSRPQEACNSTR